VPLYKTIKIATTGEFKDRGSKFLGYAFPSSSIETCKLHLAEVKKIHPKASHHCFAWRLGFDGNQFRAADDGEPSGSAGRPILNSIQSFELSDIIVVVVRYFGGSLLGVPGLINAYKSATEAALALAVFIEKHVEKRFFIEFDYTVLNEVMMVIRNLNLTIYQQEQLLFCKFDLGVKVEDELLALKMLTDIRGVSLVN
jgi:uncharacterized YigZ family protein